MDVEWLIALIRRIEVVITDHYWWRFVCCWHSLIDHFRVNYQRQRRRASYASMLQIANLIQLLSHLLFPFIRFAILVNLKTSIISPPHSILSSRQICSTAWAPNGDIILLAEEKTNWTSPCKISSRQRRRRSPKTTARNGNARCSVRCTKLQCRANHDDNLDPGFVTRKLAVLGSEVLVGYS